MIRKLINLLLLKAIQDRASRLSIEPSAGDSDVIYCIDDEDLKPHNAIPREHHDDVVFRIKKLAELDTGLTDQPQMGGVNLLIKDRSYLLQINTRPTDFGEAVDINFN